MIFYIIVNVFKGFEFKGSDNIRSFKVEKGLKFLPNNENELIKCLKNISDINFSLLFFIPAVKINFYLKSFKKIFSGRDIFIAREMTKKHETYYRGSIETINLFDKVVKGELTIVLSKIISKELPTTDLNKIEKQVTKYLKSYTVKDVVKLISKKEKVSKKIVYNLCLKYKQ